MDRRVDRAAFDRQSLPRSPGYRVRFSVYAVEAVVISINPARLVDTVRLTRRRTAVSYRQYPVLDSNYRADLQVPTRSTL